MDSFFGIGIAELFMIAVVALIVLGPERLPGALREVAKFIRTIRNLTNELTSQFGDEFKVLDDLNPQKILRELTDDPAEKTKAAKTASTKPGVKPAAKPATSSTTKPAGTKATTTKPTTPKPATTPAKPVVTPKTAGAAATTKTVATAKPVGEEAVATAEGEPVTAENSVAASTATAAKADVIVQESLEQELPEVGVFPVEATEPSVPDPIEVEAAPAALSDVTHDEPSILPPALREQAVEEQADAEITAQIEPVETEISPQAASIIESPASPVEEVVTDHAATEHVPEAVADTALDAAPDSTFPETTASDLDGESASGTAVEASSEAKRSPVKMKSASVNGTNGASAENET